MRTLDERYLRRALELAARGRGYVNPNPTVGALITRDDTVIGEGFHTCYGSDHAEVEAIKAAHRSGDQDLAGTTLYVSLEPCCHYGKTPPCTDAILAAGVKRVVVAASDPSAQVSGRGLTQLRENGVEVELAAGDIADAARLLNQPFHKHVQVQQPFVTYKYAFSLDGKVATAGGSSRWISGPESRRLVHQWRCLVDAVIIGIGTVRADDPLLTARDVTIPRQPQRIVFDRQAQLALDSQLVRTISLGPVLVVCSVTAPPARLDQLRAAGVLVLPIEAIDDVQFVLEALTKLGQRGLTHVLLEGGPRLAGSFFDAGAIDQVEAFLAPRFLGGTTAPSPILGLGGATVEDGLLPLHVEQTQVGDDLRVSARLKEY